MTIMLNPKPPSGRPSTSKSAKSRRSKRAEATGDPYDSRPSTARTVPAAGGRTSRTVFRHDDTLSRAVERIVRNTAANTTKNPWEKNEPPPIEELGRRWKKQLMFQDPFIRGFLNPSPASRPATARTECTTSSVLMAYDLTLGQSIDATRSTLPTKGNQTERMWRRKTSKAKHKKKQESGFTLRQHVNDMAIPEYDAILDQHAKFVETPAFAHHVEVTRPLTPEHQHILDNRIKMKENADLAVMALTGVLPAPPSTAGSRPTSARPMSSISARPQGSARSRRLQSAGPLGPGELELGLEHIDWADSPLMEFVLDETGLDATVVAEPDEELGFNALFTAAEARIERLWEEVCFPDVMRNKFRNSYMSTAEPANYATLLAEITCLVLYRRNILQVLQAVWNREQELREVMRGATTPESLWQLRKLTVVCLEAIEQWKQIFPWNKAFVYQGQDYVVKTNTDLSLLKGKLNASMQERQ